MRRVLVIGCPGAGKSTLTRALAETLGLPAVYLDRLWWKSGWINRTRAEFDARLDAALAGDAWVMDGNYLRTLPRRLERCDAVLFLDYPRRLCLFRALRRILRWRGRTRPDMAEGRLHRLRLEVADPHRAQPQGRRRQHHVVGEDGRVDVCGLLLSLIHI